MNLVWPLLVTAGDKVPVYLPAYAQVQSLQFELICSLFLRLHVFMDNFLFFLNHFCLLQQEKLV